MGLSSMPKGFSVIVAVVFGLVVLVLSSIVVVVILVWVPVVPVLAVIVAVVILVWALGLYPQR